MGNHTRWTDQEISIAMRMQADGKTYFAIAERLGRTYASVLSRLRFDADRNLRFLDEFRNIVPQNVLDEREARLSVNHKDITSEFFGDPLPGYSALDRRRATLSQKEAA